MILQCFRTAFGPAMLLLYLYLVNEIQYWQWWRKTLVFRIIQSRSWNYRWSNFQWFSLLAGVWGQCRLRILSTMRHFQQVFFPLSLSCLLNNSYFYLRVVATLTTEKDLFLNENPSWPLVTRMVTQENFMLEIWFLSIDLISKMNQRA